MRRIIKRNLLLTANVIADGPKMASLKDVGQELEEDATDEILQQCHEISDRLKNALQGQDKDR